MRHSVSISLPEGMYRQLKSYCVKEDANWSEVARKALRDFFYRQELFRLRGKALLEAERKGLRLTEEEIFKSVS